jgi:hypothetical protein
MECNFCNLNFDTKTGKFLIHLRKEHNIQSVTDYYYSYKENNICYICSTNNRQIIDWKFTLSETCADSCCIEKNRRNKISEAQKKLSDNGKNNFQQPEVREKSLESIRKLKEEGNLYCQRGEVKLKLSIQTTKRNLQNNPMKDEDNRKKMSASSMGKEFSAEHKHNISEGLKKYLSSLTDEELRERMDNSRKLSVNIDKEIVYDFSNLNRTFFDNIADVIKNTQRILQSSLTEKQLF